MLQFKCRHSGRAAQPHRFFTSFASLLAVVAVAVMPQSLLAAPPPRLSSAHIVREWAKASQAIVPPGKSAQLRTLHRHRRQFNGHQIALINEFRGPVDADELLKRYRFDEVTRTGNTYRLQAVARDGVERLFSPRWQIDIDAATNLPVSLMLPLCGGGNGRQLVGLLTRQQRIDIALRELPARSRPGTIVLASGQTSGSRRVQAESNRAAERKMPSLVGLPWQAVQDSLERNGFVVRLK